MNVITVLTWTCTAGSVVCAGVTVYYARRTAAARRQIEAIRRERAGS